MSKIIETTATIQSADYASDWYNSSGKSNANMLLASNAPTPKEIIVQVGLLDIVGTPDASSKIQIYSTVQGQSATLEYEKPIIADNMTDSFLFDGIKANAIQVKIFKGAMTSFKTAIDYDTIF